MDFVETEGDTIDEAIESALRLLGVDRDRVTVDILSEGRKGLLGFGAQKARVRAALRRSITQVEETHPKPGSGESRMADEKAAVGQRAKTVLTELLMLMGVRGDVEVKPGDTPEELVLEIRGENGGILIGRKGQTLEALRYLVARIVGERSGEEGPHIVVDTENYRERRRKSLEDMALRLGEKAKRQRKTVSVDALSAADRRIIHATLKDDPWLTTKSLGQGPYRRLLIIPEGDRKKKEDKKEPSSARPGAKAPR